MPASCSSSHRDRVRMLHPVVLAPHERSHRGRRHARLDLGAIEAERLDVVQQPVVVVQLFLGVVLEVVRERSA